MPDGLSQALLVEARGAAADRGGRRVLRDIDFAIGPGEIVTLVGPNGSGKSTFIGLVTGALRPEAGRIRRRKGLRLGYVPQRLQIDPTLPLEVGRFLALGNGRDTAQAVETSLARVGLPGLAARQMSALSGGETQRVLLARALMAQPELLVLDEPTQGLDQPATASLYRLIEELRRETGCAVLMASHDLHVVMSGSDRVICVNGHICCEGAPETVSETPEYRALFGTGTGGTLALYRHHHDHSHDHGHCHEPDNGHGGNSEDEPAQ